MNPEDIQLITSEPDQFTVRPLRIFIEVEVALYDADNRCVGADLTKKIAVYEPFLANIDRILHDVITTKQAQVDEE